MFLTGHRGFHFPQRRLYRSIIAKRRAAQGAVGRGYPASRDPSIFYLGRSRGLCSEGRKRHEWHIVQSSDETASTLGDLLEALKEVNRQPSNGLVNFIRQPSKMQINRQRVSRYFKSPNFSLSLDLGSWRISKLEKNHFRCSQKRSL